MSIYQNRIYDGAEKRSMPYNTQYMDRCVKEDKADKDVFGRFKKVLLLRPTEVLLRALKKKRKRPD